MDCGLVAEYLLGTCCTILDDIIFLPMTPSRRFVARRVRTVVCTLLLVATPLGAQVRYDTPTARVEILGLTRWTRRMLEDSIHRFAPGRQLHEAACMAVLRYELRFPDALVSRYVGFTGTKEFISIRLVEPSDRRAVRWRTIPTNAFAALMPEYAAIILPVTDSTGGIWMRRLVRSVDTRDSVARSRALASMDSAARTDDARLRAFLDTRRQPADLYRAMRILDTNAVFANRIAAALVLSNFAAHDESWYALVRALRDPHEAVRDASAAALRGMPRRPMDWAPVTTDVRAILAGTNLAQLESVMQLLVDTQVSPSLARPLLRDNAQWTVRLLTSEAPMAAGRASAFLTAVRGARVPDGSVTAWRAWLRQL